MKKRLFFKVSIIALAISMLISVGPMTTSAKTSRWMKFGNDWSYLESGKWKIGWFNDNSTGIPKDDRWYYFDQNGVMKKGWLYWKDEWYYLGNDGVMCDGWIEYKGKWYYLNRNFHNGTHGNMIRNEFFKSYDWYYFGDDGSMVTDTTIKGFHFGSDGRSDGKEVNATFNQIVDYAKTLGFTTVKENIKNREGQVESTYNLKKKLASECAKDEIIINKASDKVLTISTKGFCNSENYDELNKLIKLSVPSLADEIIDYLGNQTHSISLKGKRLFGDGRYVYVYTKDLGETLNYEKGELLIEIE